MVEVVAEDVEVSIQLNAITQKFAYSREQVVAAVVDVEAVVAASQCRYTVRSFPMSLPCSTVAHDGL